METVTLHSRHVVNGVVVHLEDLGRLAVEGRTLQQWAAWEETAAGVVWRSGGLFAPDAEPEAVAAHLTQGADSWPRAA